MEITASKVKELRESTGAGMMDCKKALVEADGDMAKAIENLRKSGLSKAAKKADRTANEAQSNDRDAWLACAHLLSPSSVVWF